MKRFLLFVFLICIGCNSIQKEYQVKVIDIVPTRFHILVVVDLPEGGRKSIPVDTIAVLPAKGEEWIVQERTFNNSFIRRIKQ